MDNIYKAVQLTVDSQNLALSKMPTHIYIANQYVDTNDTPLITAPFIIQKALENGTGVVDIVSSTIGSIYEVRLLCDAEVLISGYFYMPPMNVKFSELELYTSYPPRTPPVINEFWQKTENFILEKTNTLLNFVQVFNSLSSMRLSLGYLEELLTTKKSNLVSAINEVYKRYEGVGDLYEKNVAAAGAGAAGWTDLLVNNIDKKPLRSVNIEQVESIADLDNLTKLDKRTVIAKSYHAPIYALANPFKGGGTFIYDESKANVNDNGLVFNGWVRAEQTYLTPDMFGAKPNDTSFDNTDALNRAFATGRNIYGKKDDIYYVKGILNTKGQQLIGGWKISTSRYNLGVVSTEVTPANNAVIKMLYLESAYDLSELLFIKSLGFNTINHYGYFANNGTIDAGGTLSQLLDNAKTAGLQVNLGTENDEAKANLVNYIQKYDSHPSVWGYSVYDEPATRGISVADQDAKITQLRGLTQKYLSMVDLLVVKSTFKQVFSTNYDIVFVDSYATRNGKATLQERINKDLENMRMDFGGIKAMTKQQRIYPVVSAMVHSGGLYTDDLAQIIATSEIYGKVGGGNFGMFPWDGVGEAEIIGRLRDNAEFKALAKRLNAQDTRKQLVTEVHIFGGTPSDTDWGVQDLLNNLVKTDPFTSDPYVAGSAYPIVLMPTGVDTDRTSSLNGKFSGIGMKGTYSALPTSIKGRKNVRAKLEYFHTTSTPEGTFQLVTTNDGGYTIGIQYEDAISGTSKVFDFNTKSISYDNTLIFRVMSGGDSATTKYRKFLRGIVITTDW